MERYEITIAGLVDRRRVSALGCDELRVLPDGNSLLAFAAIDQASLYGLFARLRDAGIALVAVNPVPSGRCDETGAGAATGAARDRGDSQGDV